MLLTLARHGGFAGLRRPPLVVDTATLAPEIGRKLEALVHAARAHPGKTRPRSPAAPAQPDRFSYTLTVGATAAEGGESTHEIDEADAPEPLLALVAAVQDSPRKSP